MAFMGVSLFSLSLFLLCYGGLGRNISKYEEQVIENQLNLLNKPHIKSFKARDGRIYDCVEIHKQPAFDHPKLKNHNIQIMPSSFPKGLTPSRDFDVYNSSWFGDFIGGNCPNGTVILKRISKEDLIRTKSFSDIHPFTQSNPGSHYANTMTSGDNAYYGAQAFINLYNPVVPNDQSSETVMSLSNGPPELLNSIDIGWTVNPKLYGDGKTHYFSRWTADGYRQTGCYNTYCPGFVQISPKYTMDFVPWQTSTYGGVQTGNAHRIFQDKETGNWWLLLGYDHIIEYWPKSIFTSLSGFADKITWGGATYSPLADVNKPQMGSGHFPDEGYSRACFFANIQLKTINDDDFRNPDESKLLRITDKPNCYRVHGKAFLGEYGYAFFFGGPGGICGY